MGCNYLALPLIPASGTTLLNSCTNTCSVILRGELVQNIHRSTWSFVHFITFNRKPYRYPSFLSFAALCPSDCYQIVDESSSSQSQASDICNSHGAFLTSIETIEKMGQLQSWISSLGRCEFYHNQRNMNSCKMSPDSKVRGANMGPICGRQDPHGPHVGYLGISH